MPEKSKANAALLRSAKRQLKEFEESVREHETLGGADPEDRPAIEANYKYHKQAMLNILNAVYSWQTLGTPGAVKR